MTRPQIEFIQAAALPWRRGLYGRARPDVRSKMLSIDKESGESSVIVKYPPGWKRPKKEHLLVDEEIFVLEGSIRIAGIEYERHCYAHLPAGYERLRQSSKDGAVVLTFFSGAPRAKPGKAERGLYKKKRLVKYLDTWNMPWSRSLPDGSELDPNLPGIGGMKSLRVDPDNEDFTFLYGTMPQGHPVGWAGKLETHPVVEEMYLLAGENSGNKGIMRPGAYFWRPPGIEHGPYGTITGCLSFFRTKGGMLVNNWSRHKVGYTYAPRHRPVLQKELRRYARETPAGPLGH